VEWVDALDALLHHVVAVLVLDALEHVALQLGDNDLEKEQKHLLNWNTKNKR
jgi:hypothetical protein